MNDRLIKYYYSLNSSINTNYKDDNRQSYDYHLEPFRKEKGSSQSTKLYFQKYLTVSYCHLIMLLISSFIINTNAHYCQSCHPTLPDVLNVHIVCHTHLDTGWLKTYDGYYNNDVKRIYDSVIISLIENSKRRFIAVEASFLTRWYMDQEDSVKEEVKKLVSNGQLEFIGGGWSMNDEAAAHYSDIIDNFSYGHKKLEANFGKCGIARSGWQIDPFGHSREQASLLAQMGFDSFFLGRIDYQDAIRRKQKRMMEFIWKSSSSTGDKCDIFTNVLPNVYRTPSGFCFDLKCKDPELTGQNIESKSKEFIDLVKRQSLAYGTKHTIVTMGDDFYYRDAERWYRNLDYLIKSVNSIPDSGVNLIYSTPSCYAKALSEINKVWLDELEDFFPYADVFNAYWTGYFTSRPSLKYAIKMGSNILHVANHLNVLALKDYEHAKGFEELKGVMGILQHHDAVTGTSQQHVAYDYLAMLSKAKQKAYESIVSAFTTLMGLETESGKSKMGFCDEMNSSVCPFTESIQGNTSIVMSIYNPLAHPLRHFVRVPVANSSLYEVIDHNQKIVASQLVPVFELVGSLPEKKGSPVTHELVFLTTLDPLGISSYLITSANSKDEGVLKESHTSPTKKDNWILKESHTSPTKKDNWLLKESLTSTTKKDNWLSKESHTSPTKKDNWLSKESHTSPTKKDNWLHNGKIGILIDSLSGLIKEIQLSGGKSIPFKQDFYYYPPKTATSGGEKPSGAYIFNPDVDAVFSLGRNVKFKIYRGELVDEVHQVFNDWCGQVIRLYKNYSYIEFDWFIGPIPDKYRGINVNGMEIITRYDTNLENKEIFFTDSNGRGAIKRVRNYRPWPLNTTKKVSNNYYPVTSWIYIKDNKRDLQMTVFTDRTEGGSSIFDGTIELMLHRRLMYDDWNGLGEPLDEHGVDGAGLKVRGKHRLIIGRIEESVRSMKKLSKTTSWFPVYLFHKVSNTDGLDLVSKLYYIGIRKKLPANVHLLQLERWSQHHISIRLEHIYEINDGKNHSKNAEIILDGLFTSFIIEDVQEMTLTSVDELERSEKSKFRFQSGRNSSESFNSKTDPLKGSDGTFMISLKPMEIRTFWLRVKPRI